MSVVYDQRGHFQGHYPNEGCEHRAVGDHRAWCHDCREWCYPTMPCIRCERAQVPAPSTKEEAP